MARRRTNGPSVVVTWCCVELYETLGQEPRHQGLLRSSQYGLDSKVEQELRCHRRCPDHARVADGHDGRRSGTQKPARRAHRQRDGTSDRKHAESGCGIS